MCWIVCYAMDEAREERVAARQHELRMEALRQGKSIEYEEGGDERGV